MTFDGPTKRINLGSGETTVSVRELWSRWVDWVATSDNSKFLPAFEQVGGQTIDAGAGTSIPIYAFLLNGWRIKPQEANHTLTINDGVLLVDGGGDPIVNTTGSFTVRVNYSQPVQAITVATGGSSGGLTTEQANMLSDIAKIHGLIAGISLVVSPTARSAGDITQTITDVAGTVTVTRT